VFIDGVSKGSISFAGTTGSSKAPTLGVSRSYAGLSSGSHTFELRNMSGAVYVDGFCIENGTSTGTPSSGPGATTSSSSVPVPTSANSVSVVAEATGNLPIRVVLLAPPGAGKGTQGAIIANHFGVAHIATGDLLRSHIAHETSLGLAVRDILARGDLVPDSIVLEMLRDALAYAKRKNGGYVIDGIPRTMEQAHAAFEIATQLDMTADVALCLDVDDDELTHRLLARATVEHRTDDTPEVIAKRLELYHQVTAPLLGWFDERGILITIDGTPPIEVVTTEILVTLEIVYADILARLAVKHQ